MNDFEIDQYFEGINNDVSSSIEDRILSSSTKALKRSRFIRKSIQRGVLTTVILVFGLAAFMTGRLSVNKDTTPLLAKNGHDEMVTINVNKDFLAWIDAGRFFTQIEMKTEAVQAFDKAISMIPKVNINMTNQDTQKAVSFNGSLINIGVPTLDTMAMVNTQFLQYSTNPR